MKKIAIFTDKKFSSKKEKKILYIPLPPLEKIEEFRPKNCKRAVMPKPRALDEQKAKLNNVLKTKERIMKKMAEKKLKKLAKNKNK